MLKKVMGGGMVVFGAMLLLWVGYNLFIHRTEEAKNRSPVAPLIFAGGLIGVGYKWVRGEQAG